MNMINRNFVCHLMLGSSLVSVVGYFGDEGVYSGFGRRQWFFFGSGRRQWFCFGVGGIGMGREGSTTHGVRIVGHSMSCLQTGLISVLYKPSL